jgi:hypothetical protein
MVKRRTTALVLGLLGTMVIPIHAQSTASSTQRAQVDALFQQMDAAQANLQVSRARALQAQATLYELKIERAIRDQFLAPNVMPTAVCLLHLVQKPGGYVVSAKVDPSCPYDAETRRSLEMATLRATPLPYPGFEYAFQANMDIPFHPQAEHP